MASWWTEDDLRSQKELWRQLIALHEDIVEAAEGKEVDHPDMLALYPGIGSPPNLCSAMSQLCVALMREKGAPSFVIADCMEYGCPVFDLCIEALRALNMIRRAVLFNLGQEGSCDSAEQREHNCVYCGHSEACLLLPSRERVPFCLLELKALAAQAQEFIDGLPEFRGL